jgi:hypothetical protein
MATDLFALFPDLPWPRIGHPPARLWSEPQLPSPPRPRQLFQDRERSAVRDAALRQILEIAQRERRRLTARSVGARALDKIIRIARAAL